jgi:hypothetical protein
MQKNTNKKTESKAKKLEAFHAFFYPKVRLKASRQKLSSFSEKSSYLFLKYSRRSLEAGGGKIFPREIRALPPCRVSRSPWIHLS